MKIPHYQWDRGEERPEEIGELSVEVSGDRVYATLDLEDGSEPITVVVADLLEAIEHERQWVGVP